MKRCIKPFSAPFCHSAWLVQRTLMFSDHLKHISVEHSLFFCFQWMAHISHLLAHVVYLYSLGEAHTAGRNTQFAELLYFCLSFVEQYYRILRIRGTARRTLRRAFDFRSCCFKQLSVLYRYISSMHVQGVFLFIMHGNVCIGIETGSGGIEAEKRWRGVFLMECWPHCGVRVNTASLHTHTVLWPFLHSVFTPPFSPGTLCITASCLHSQPHSQGSRPYALPSPSVSATWRKILCGQNTIDAT